MPRRAPSAECQPYGTLPGYALAMKTMTVSSRSQAGHPENQPAGRPADERNDDAEEIRYSLTSLGEAVLTERRGRPFRGFGPCEAGRPSSPFAH